MKYQFRFLIAVVLGLCMWADTAFAGWVVTYQDSESKQKSQEFYQDGKANLESMIYRGEGQNLFVVDQDSRAYWHGSPAQYCEAMRGLKQKMEAQMASMPAQYKPVPISQKKVTTEKIGTQPIAGFSATGYEFYVDGSQSGRVWVSADKGLRDLINLERSMAKDFKCFDNMDGFSVEESALYKKTTQNAFVLKESYRQVVSVKKADIASNKFAAPDGYKSFSDYQQFMDYSANQQRSSSPSTYSTPSIPEDDSHPDSASEDELAQRIKKAENVHAEERRSVVPVEEKQKSSEMPNLKELPKDIEKTVKGLFNLFKK